MKLQNIKVADAKQSATNVKGRNEGKSFDELVASVKEKGVLVPVLARALKTTTSKKLSETKKLTAKDNTQYEVIAGNRRLAAAKEAGLEEIPAQIVEMTDVEAREAQIVENLQREGVHPLDEGESYRQLIEESKYEISSIAAKVGKSESYVKQRLFLTNLEEKMATAYRTGKINDGHAVLIAKLSAEDQPRALKAATDRYELMSVKELKEWIEKNIYTNLDNQPWLGSPELMKVVGPCKECEPPSASLFGDVKEGACTSLPCWQRKMLAYLNHRIKTEKLHAISDEYGESPKGVLSRSNYVLISGKDKCDSAHKALVVNGGDIGKIKTICSDKDCKTHGRNQSGYSLTPKEKERRKAEIKKEKAKAAAEVTARAKALKKVKWPMTEKTLNMLLETKLERGTMVLRPVCQRREIKPITTTIYYDSAKKQGYKSTSWEKPLRQAVAKMTKQEKAQLLVELTLVDNSYTQDKLIKLL